MDYFKLIFPASKTIPCDLCLSVFMPLCISSHFESWVICATNRTSVQFSHSVVSDSMRPHEQKHARPPCPSPTPGVDKLMSIKSVMQSNHLILCRPLLLLPSLFPSIRVFSKESVLTSGGQSVGVSASASVLPMNIHDWFALGLTVAWSPCIDSINTERG